MKNIMAEATDDSSHIVNPTVAEDEDAIRSYLAATTEMNGRRLIRASSDTNAFERPTRPVLFGAVPRRPVGRTVRSSRTAEKCEIIGKIGRAIRGRTGAHVSNIAVQIMLE